MIGALANTFLRDTNLHSMNFVGVDFGKAILRRADLSGANLSGTDCKSVNIDSCDLQSVILTKSKNLTQKAVNCAKGSAQTELPIGLVKPDHWLEVE